MEAMQEKPVSPHHHPFNSPWLLWIVWIVWLPFLVPGIIQLLNPPPSSGSVLVLSVMAVFVLIYCFFSFRRALALSGRSAQEDDGQAASLKRTGVVLIMLGLCAAAEILGRSKDLDVTSLFIYTAAYAGTAFRIPRAIVTNAVVLGVCLALGGILGLSLPALLFPVFLVVVVSFMTMSWTRSVIVGRKLHEAQGEIARLAAAEERLRIARDLHDILGQKLSFIALKSELARHLVASAPERAEAEIAEVESTVRSTLQEVREAVAGYRKPDLFRELRAAAEILSAAGIQLENRCNPPLVASLSTVNNEALAWAVREGVTNVIRHSRARTCLIELSEKDGLLTMEIADDGSGDSAAAEGHPGRGNGLRGLRERFSALGGECRAGGREQGGFAVTATIPTGRVK
jgi:two-component system, NarL family, sensor histidine kinase DesK